MVFIAYNRKEIFYEFAEKLVSDVDRCFDPPKKVEKRGRPSMLQVRREAMWSSYHTLSTSDTFAKNRERFLTVSINSLPNPILCVLKVKIKTLFPITAHSVNVRLGTLRKMHYGMLQDTFHEQYVKKLQSPLTLLNSG